MHVWGWGCCCVVEGGVWVCGPSASRCPLHARPPPGRPWQKQQQEQCGSWWLPPSRRGNLTVYVGDMLPAALLAQAAGSGDRSGGLCAAGVAALGRQPLEVDCGRLMHGAEAAACVFHACWIVMCVLSCTAQPKVCGFEGCLSSLLVNGAY